MVVPRVGNDCERLAWRLGELIGDDVEAYEVQRVGRQYARLLIMRDGKEFELLIRPSKESQSKAPKSQRTMTIVETVAEVYGLPATALLSGPRTKQLAEARGLAMYLAKIDTGRSFRELAEDFGRHDHSSVIKCVRKVKALLVTDKCLALRAEACLVAALEKAGVAA